MSMDISHRFLCEFGAKWLKNQPHWEFRCQYVAIEIVTGSKESPDIFGWRGAYHTINIEVKVSRTDFKKDFTKQHRKGEGIGMNRYYLCPEGMIKPEELPENWGLLYFKDNKIEVIKKSGYFEQRCHSDEAAIMYSIMRRLAKPQVFNFRATPTNHQ